MTIFIYAASFCYAKYDSIQQTLKNERIICILQGNVSIDKLVYKAMTQSPMKQDLWIQSEVRSSSLEIEQD